MFKETAYSTPDLFGHVDLLRNVLPTLRGSVRRNDPDGFSAAPYFPSLNGKNLNLEYTDAANVVQNIVITFTSTSYALAVTAINAAAPSDIGALDLDGFLQLTNKNDGGTHYLKVVADGTPANDAATILGFAVYPFHGSISYAGEFASSAASRLQSNPQGTALVSRDENLSSGTVNRGFASVLQYVDRIRVDVDYDVIVYREVSVSETTHTGSGLPAVNINDPTIRLPINGLGISGFPTLSTDLDDIFEFTDAGGATVYNASYNKLSALNAYYAAIGSTLTPGASFATWGTPDGGSIYGTDIPSKTKQASTAISTIVGNVVYCPGATFQTKFCQKNDPVRISGATNTLPFSHNGWFAVVKVIDETHLELRPMSDKEAPPSSYSTEFMPRALNPTTGASFGNLSVHFGNFIPASSIWIVLDSAVSVSKVRIACAVPKRDVTPQDIAFTGRGSSNTLGTLLLNHINNPTGAHAATAISGFTSAVAWYNSTNASGATLKATIENLIQQLVNSSANDSSLTRLGAETVAVVGSTTSAPTSIPSGSLFASLQFLVSKLAAHMNDGVAHAGAGATYSGSGPWADGSVIAPGVTIDTAIDDIVADLAATTASADGAQKIGLQALVNWLGGRTNPASDVYHAFNKIINDLAATTASDDGAERIGAQLTSDLSAGSVRSQLDSLATNWGKLSRQNTWSALQTVNGASGDLNPVFQTTSTPVTRKLLWYIKTSTAHIRIFSVAGAGLEITHNAGWGGTDWGWDVSGSSIKLAINSSQVILYTRLTSDTDGDTFSPSRWFDTTFREVFNFDLSETALTRILRLGHGDTNSAARALLPRVQAERATSFTRTLMFEFVGSGFSARFYYSNSPIVGEAFEISLNARWDGSNWNRDTAVDSSLYVIGRDNLYVLHHLSGEANPWADTISAGTTWTQAWKLAFTQKTFVDMSTNTSNPSGGGSTNYANQIHAKNILKTWALVEVTGNGTAALANIVDGFNVNTVAGDGTTLVRVNLPYTIGTDCAIFLQMIDPSTSGGATTSTTLRKGTPMVEVRQPTYFEFSIVDKSTGSKINLSTNTGSNPSNDVLVAVAIYGVA